MARPSGSGKCHHCQGTGKVYSILNSRLYDTYERCSACEGTGKCGRCDGTGEVDERGGCWYCYGSEEYPEK